MHIWQIRLRSLIKENFRWICIFCFWSFAFSYICGVFDDKVEVGQTWVYRQQGNPFDKGMVHRKEVIGVNGAYALYVLDSKDTLSAPKPSFRRGSDLLKKGECSK